MSNLGAYQKMTTWSKKMGGPKPFLCTVAIGGYVILRTVELSGKIIKKTLKKRLPYKKERPEYLYTIHTASTNDKDLNFSIGDKFNVLEIDKNVVLIEKKGDMNNPYCVSLNWLQSISDFDGYR